jgi:hypothetical protein
VPGYVSDGPLARGLIRIGDEAIAREDDTRLRDYYTEDYLHSEIHDRDPQTGHDRSRPDFQVEGNPDRTLSPL